MVALSQSGIQATEAMEARIPPHSGLFATGQRLSRDLSMARYSVHRRHPDSGHPEARRPTSKCRESSARANRRTESRSAERPSRQAPERAESSARHRTLLARPESVATSEVRLSAARARCTNGMESQVHSDSHPEEAGFPMRRSIQSEPAPKLVRVARRTTAPATIDEMEPERNVLPPKPRRYRSTRVQGRGSPSPFRLRTPPGNAPAPAVAPTLLGLKPSQIPQAAKPMR